MKKIILAAFAALALITSAAPTFAGPSSGQCNIPTSAAHFYHRACP